jgi:rhamnosyl/mannosyltransferase
MYDLMLGLSEQQVHCDMLCASTEDHPAGTMQLNPYARLIVVPTRVKLAATMLSPGMITTLRKIAKEYAIIHVHHPDPMACLALFLSGYKGKVVLHWHSDILKQKTLLKLYAPLQRWLINRADLIVGTTPVYVRQSAALSKVQHKIDYIPIGVEPIQVDQAKATALRQRYHGKKIIFSLGRLVAYKGYEYLIRAAQNLGQDYKVIIGGTGPLRDELVTLIHELQVEDRVELIGFVKDEEVPDYFAACDVFCLSSIWKTEAFAIVQIEAMSCGKPVISTSIPGSGVSWVNAHDVSGLVVEPENAVGLAEAVKHVFASPDSYTRLCEGSRNRYLELFTRDKMIDKCMYLYSKIMEWSMS